MHSKQRLQTAVDNMRKIDTELRWPNCSGDFRRVS